MRFFVLIFLLVNLSLQAQNNYEINGRAVSENEGLPYVSVYIKGTTIGTTTDDFGNFKLTNLSQGTYHIIASFVGYKTVSKKINVTADIDGLTFNLEFDDSLDEVVVTGTLKPVADWRVLFLLKFTHLHFLKKTQHQMFLKPSKM
jgi:outer membrane receptor for ferrienterochelin and colicins